MCVPEFRYGNLRKLADDVPKSGWPVRAKGTSPESGGVCFWSDSEVERKAESEETMMSQR